MTDEFISSLIPHPLSFNRKSHTFRRAFDRFHCRFKICRVQILHFRFRNFFDLGARNRTDLRFVRSSRTFCNARRFSQKISRRRCFCFKCKRTICINGNNDGDFHIRVVILRFCVERFAKFHNVHAVLSECRTDRRRGISFPRRNL